MINNIKKKKGILLERAIGVIDSGVGGLTVAHELMRQLPKEKLIYLGDTLRCPYGPRSKEEIKNFTWEMVEFLLRKDIKMLVVACNTATAYTLEELQQELPIPVIGVIQPGARAAIKTTKNNHVAIIGTEGTVRSNAYTHALKKINTMIQIESLACPLFVPMVEQGVLSGKQAEQIVAETLKPLQHKAIDTLILGCTHYPLIKDTIQQVMGSKINIISSSEETARETSALLDIHGIASRKDSSPKHQFYTTGELEIFTKITNTIFNSSIENLQVVTFEKAVI